MFKHVLFDLDGTLTDSKEGIIKSVEYALLKLGESTEGRLDQHIVVGPPMMTTFMAFPKKKRGVCMIHSRNGTVPKGVLKTIRSRESWLFWIN